MVNNFGVVWYTCVNCEIEYIGEPVFGGNADPWCEDCFDGENERSKTQDFAGYASELPGRLGYLGKKAPWATTRTRPPKYMLKKEEWAQYGYQ